MSQPPDPSPAAGFTIGKSAARGCLGFGGVSLAVYALWAWGGGWLGKNLGEAGFYAVCAVVFMTLAPAALHRLVADAMSRRRFYVVFTGAFLAYALGWSLAWFALRGKAGEWLGSLAGTVLMALALGRAAGSMKLAGRLAVILFVTHSAGYFLGGWIYGWLRSPAGAEAVGAWLDKPGRAAAAKLLWGAAHGAGFGAGLGWALHLCRLEISLQAQSRRT